MLFIIKQQQQQTKVLQAVLQLSSHSQKLGLGWGALSLLILQVTLLTVQFKQELLKPPCLNLKIEIMISIK